MNFRYKINITTVLPVVMFISASKRMKTQCVVFCMRLLYNKYGDIMTKIMFICHGNICRSPMAEFIFRDLANKMGVGDNFYASSSATSTEEIWNGVGNPVYPPAKAELKKHGILCDGKQAVQLKKSDYDNYDLLVCMDSQNVRNALRILGSDTENKVYKLMNFTARGGDVADPWYSGNFETAYNDIFEGCTALIQKLTGENR